VFRGAAARRSRRGCGSPVSLVAQLCPGALEGRSGTSGRASMSFRQSA
jgi:hypothetical protein